MNSFKVAMSGHSQSMTYQEILGRVRKDIGYSPLTTILMQQMKSLGVYEDFKKKCIQLSIKGQKNTAVNVFGLCVLYRELVGKKYEHTPKEASNLICNKLRHKLNGALKNSCCKKNKKENVEQLITVAQTVLSQDIEWFRRILMTDPSERQLIKEFVTVGLYNNQSSKRKHIQKIARIFCEQRIDLEQTGADDLKQPEPNFEEQEVQPSEPVIYISDLVDNDNSVDQIIRNYYEEQDNRVNLNFHFDFFSESQIFYNQRNADVNQ